MKFLNLFNRKKRKTVLIVQCRLSSTRLPRKALLPLGGKFVIDWVLDAMSQVPADEYYLATDTPSAAELLPIAQSHNWKFFAGSTQDVLERFCKIIEESKADVVVRATADNPFLFYEAASALEEEFYARDESSPVDYITFSDLPHGSGVEMFNAHSLLKAASLTNESYDHEHVGPALYNHRESFNCLFIKAPNRWNYSELRTTIDTPSDYRRALALVHAVSGKKVVTKPYTTEEILNGMWNNFVRNPVLLVPCVAKGRGTGHLRRSLSLALETGQDVYIPDDAGLEQCASLVEEAKANGLEDYQIVKDLSDISQYHLIVTDLFSADDGIVQTLSKSAVPVAALDEGRLDTSYVDYLLDIIPSVGLNRKANLVESGFIPLPQNRRNDEEKNAAIHTALVTLGGEDPAGLTLPSSVALAKQGLYVTAVSSSKENAVLLQENLPVELNKFIKVVPPIENLREKLYSYDLVVTHYGFTAFEAANAGCAVLLLGTSALHEELAKTYGFECISSSLVTEQAVKNALSVPEKLYRASSERKNLSLADFIVRLSEGEKLSCPVCRTKTTKPDAVVARTGERTFRRCQKCGMLYMSWTVSGEASDYGRSYFYEDYKKQYGKTYLDDFASIKAQGVRRITVIDYVFKRIHSPVTPTILDIGCAMGPFMDAANDSGWQVFGIDISKDAVEYVQTTLKYPAVCSPFPAFNPGKEFGLQQFDAVTMWYVIEHFKDLDAVLKAVSGLVKKGGVFAFSTPSASGVSGKYNSDEFFAQSPADHYTLWEPARAKSILKKYGFTVSKIVSTGIHPERFPSAKKHGWKENSLQLNVLGAASRAFRLGDTFEVYCKKTGEAK